MSRTIVVAGGASGIGLAVAQQAVADGWRAVVVDRQEPLEPVEARVVRCDLMGDRATVALEALAAEEGDIDALVVSAGGAINARLDQLSAQEWCDYLANDTTIVLRTVRALLPAVQRAAESKGIADIVVMGSIASDTAFPDAAVYGMISAARNALGQQLRPELRLEQVRARVIATGFVATPLTERLDSRAARPITVPLRASDVAQVVHHGLNLPPDTAVHDVVVVPTSQGWA